MPVRLFAPLRAKITSSAQSLVPPSGRPSQGSSLSILTEPHDELAPFHTRSPRRRYSRNETLWNIGSELLSLRLDVGRDNHLAPFFGLVGDELAEIGGRACEHRAA